MGINYYLKSDRDTYKKHYIKLIRHRHFGNEFYVLYDVMLHESIDHNGTLRNSDVLPFDDDTLCMVAFGDCIIGPRDIKHFTEIVHDGLILFRELGLIEIHDDKTIVMLKLPEKTASTSAERVQKCRNKKKQDETLQKQNGNVTVTLHPVSCNAENGNHIDLLKSLEIKDKKESKKEDVTPVIVEPPIDYLKISEYWNEKMAGKQIPKTLKKMSGSRKSHINARIADHGIEKLFMMIDLASESKFLNGDNERGWTANFDWCLNPSNYAKIIEGNYSNKGGNKNGNSGKPVASSEFTGHGTAV